MFIIAPHHYIPRLYDEKEKEGNIVEKQLLKHNLELEKLHQKGNALMTNVRTVCERRQLEQRKKEKIFQEGMKLNSAFTLHYIQNTL